MRSSHIIYVLTLLCVAVQADYTVQQYNEIINAFIQKTNNYSYPTDSRQYAQGSNLTGCINGGTHDFIIVGAGSTGTVLANRLTENTFGRSFNVLLLEAGGEETAFSDIPAMFDYLRLSNEFNWGYKSVPQTNSLLSYVNRTEIIPRGRVLGGTSVINAMMYSRGNKLDYDGWAAAGNPGWSYKDVLPFFKISENASIAREDPGYHGHSGPLHVEDLNSINPTSQAYLAAQQELGRKILDYNGKIELGFSRIQATEKNGRRFSGAKAFLAPIRNRTNLQVTTHALVLQILIKNKRAYGVKYVKNKQTFCVYANNEVILSAGSINSPQLLMLSGIGPKQHLQELGINVIKDLPVGENLWDHLCFALQPFTTNQQLTDLTQIQKIQMYLQGKGEYTVADDIQDMGFTSLYWPNKVVPDVEFIYRTSKMPNAPYSTYKQSKNFNENIYNYIFKPLTGKVTWNSYSILLHPKSRGNIRLKSNSPLDFPLINPQYLTDQQNSDVNTLVQSIKDMINVANTKAMQKYHSEMFKIDLPGCRMYDFGTDLYYACLVRHLASTIHHFAGTCKMGPVCDKTAVVDSSLRVHGIDGLRVADCSVIPVTISGHTNAVAFMIGEKCAVMIKSTYIKPFIYK